METEITDKQNTAVGGSDVPTCSGKGYQLTNSPLTLTLFFAVLSDDGEDAGVGIKMSIEDMKNPPSLEDINSIVAEGEREGFEGYALRAVTPEEYKAAEYE